MTVTTKASGKTTSAMERAVKYGTSNWTKAKQSMTVTSSMTLSTGRARTLGRTEPSTRVIGSRENSMVMLWSVTAMETHSKESGRMA